MAVRTVDGNGNSLSQLEAICANESRNLAKGVDGEILRCLVWLGVNDLNVESVGFGSHQSTGGTAVALRNNMR